MKGAPRGRARAFLELGIAYTSADDTGGQDDATNSLGNDVEDQDEQGSGFVNLQQQARERLVRAWQQQWGDDAESEIGTTSRFKN